MNEEGFSALVKYMAKEKETEDMKYKRNEKLDRLKSLN